MKRHVTRVSLGVKAPKASHILAGRRPVSGLALILLGVLIACPAPLSLMAKPAKMAARASVKPAPEKPKDPTLSVAAVIAPLSVPVENTGPIVPINCPAPAKPGMFGLSTITQVSSNTFGFYGISGDKGKFICQVSNRKLDIQGPNMEGSLGSSRIDPDKYQDRRLDMPQTTERLEAVIKELSRYWPYEKPDNVKVVIVGSQSYLAEACLTNTAPYNIIKLHLGTFSQAKNEHEIVYMLAHEYAHLLLQHLKRNKMVQDQNRLMTTLSTIYGTAVYVNQINAAQSQNGLDISLKDADKVVSAQKRAQSSSRDLHSLLDIVIMPAYTRSQEDEADAIAYDLMRKSGYNADMGSSNFYNTIEADEERTVGIIAQLEQNVQKNLEDTEALKAAAGKATDTSLVTGTTAQGSTIVNGEVNNYTSKIWQDFQAKGTSLVKDALSAGHRPAKERRANLEKYIAKAYPEDQSDIHPGKWFAAIRSSKEYIDARNAVDAVSDSFTLRLAQKPKEAELKMLAIQNSDYRNTPMVLNEWGRVYADEHEYQKADEKFLLAHKHKYQVVLGYREHIDMLLHTGRWTEANTVLSEAVNRYRTDEKPIDSSERPFFPELIEIQFAQGKEKEALATLQKCLDFEDRALIELCVKSTPDPDTSRYRALKPETQIAVNQARGKVADKRTLNSQMKVFSDGVGGLFKAPTA